MPITINTNVSAMISQRNLASSSARSASSLSKLSSGSRVPTAKEDAASLAVGTGLRLDVSALKAAQVNAQQATSMLQIADGAFGQISDVLTRMKSLATTAQSAQLSDTERGYLNDEFLNLQNEIDRIAGSTEFNGTKLLGGETELSVANGDTIFATAGVEGVTVDDTKVNVNEDFDFDFTAATGTLTVTNNTSGASQSLSVPSISAGSTAKLNFGQLGVEITLAANFSTAADINVATAFTAVDTNGVVSQQADLDFQVGTQSGDVINVKIDQGNYKSLVNGPQQVESNITGANLTAANGILGIEVDGNLRNTSEFAEISWDNTAGGETLTVTIYDGDPTGTGVAIASQAIDVSAQVTAGNIDDVNFDELGVTANIDFTAITAGPLPANSGGDYANFGFEINNVAGSDRTTADISSVANAQIATAQVDDASVSVNTARANLGSNMNRLEFASSNLAVTIENTEAARSTLMDVDVSAEITKFSSEQVLIQAGVSMLAQANQQPSLLLRLLQ